MIFCIILRNFFIKKTFAILPIGEYSNTTLKKTPVKEYTGNNNKEKI